MRFLLTRLKVRVHSYKVADLWISVLLCTDAIIMSLFVDDECSVASAGTGCTSTLSISTSSSDARSSASGVVEFGECGHVGSVKSRCWVFTLNNYTVSEEAALVAVECTYLVFGHEVAPDTGTLHLQGYLVFKNRVRLKTCKLINARAHWLPAKGDSEKNFTYCTKSDVDGFHEHGKRPRTRRACSALGGRANADRYVKARVDAAAGNYEDIPADLFIRHRCAFKGIRMDYLTSRDVGDLDVLDNHWLYGPSGTGKSRYARSEFPGIYSKMLNKWWDGYEDHTHVLVEDVGPVHEQWITHFLKIWSDHYAFLAESKNVTLKIRPKVIVVTSQYPIEGIFKDPETVAALKRRFKCTRFRPSLLAASHCDWAANICEDGVGVVAPVVERIGDNFFI